MIAQNDSLVWGSLRLAPINSELNYISISNLASLSADSKSALWILILVSQLAPPIYVLSTTTDL